jgi:hypothetical protein
MEDLPSQYLGRRQGRSLASAKPERSLADCSNVRLEYGLEPANIPENTVLGFPPDVAFLLCQGSLRVLPLEMTTSNSCYRRAIDRMRSNRPSTTEKSSLKLEDAIVEA